MILKKGRKISFSIPGDIESDETDDLHFFLTLCAYHRCESLKKYLKDPPMHLIMYHPDDKRKRPANEPTEEQLREIAIASAEKLYEYRNKKNADKSKKSKKK